MKNTQTLQDELFEASLTIDTTADTLNVFVSLFHGNPDQMPTDEVIGNALYGVVRTLNNVSKELSRISAAHKEIATAGGQAK